MSLVVRPSGIFKVAVVLLFAGCSAHGGSSPLPESVTPDSKTNVGEDLLYATEAHNVFIYTYPDGKKINHIRRSAGMIPEGECADKNGNVYVIFNFILTSGDTFVYEYAHGGTKRIRSLGDSGQGQYDSSCSVDPVTRDVALTGAHAYVIIFKNGTNAGTIYHLPAGFFPWACAYDDHGNLSLMGLRPENQSAM